jgi:hypothetical protein
MAVSASDGASPCRAPAYRAYAQSADALSEAAKFAALLTTNQSQNFGGRKLKNISVLIRGGYECKNLF